MNIQRFAFFLLLFLFQSAAEARRKGGGNRDRGFESNRPNGIGVDPWEEDDEELDSPTTTRANVKVERLGSIIEFEFINSIIKVIQSTILLFHRHNFQIKPPATTC